MKKQQEECPKCHQFKVISNKEKYMMGAVVSLFLFFISGIFAIILIGIPFMILFVIVGLTYLIMGLAPKAAHIKKCRACGYEFDDRETKAETAKA
jgi:hypothetical protein